jgi:ATP-dependent 26S proteasome regulatory subunit
LSEDRTVIYLPNQLIDSITNPGFIPLMAEYSGSILVIEDADEAIKSRKAGGTTVDKLLNLADGILSDFLGTQIICTFNNELSSIDDALLRKGRLILKHEFGKLSAEESQKLSNKLGFKTTITEDMTLAEIYNQEDTLSDIEVKNNKIGFGR